MGTTLVVVGACVGAPLRYLVGLVAARRPGFPWGTLAVNVAGSGALGLLVGVGLGATDAAYVALGTGFCGALTTWSTFGAETVALWARHERRTAVLYLVATLVGGTALAALGVVVGRSAA